MFEISMLGDVNNLDVALDVARRFLRFEGGSDAPGAPAESDRPASAAPPGEKPDVESLMARFNENPDRNVLLWLLDVVFDISAPVHWWKQIQQYEVDIFWLRRSGELERGKRLLSEKDFDGAISPEKLFILNNYIRDGQPEMTIKILPLNFIQRGFLKTTYKTLNEIHCDKADIADDRWEAFLDYLRTLPYNELITQC